MTLEEARYIIVYYSNLLTQQERQALRHSQSTYKLDGLENKVMIDAYYAKGWLSTDPEVLHFLNEGPDQFMINSATRILREHPDQVFLNLCPVCGKLARTPEAKQCRFCGRDWH